MKSLVLIVQTIGEFHNLGGSRVSNTVNEVECSFSNIHVGTYPMRTSTFVVVFVEHEADFSFPFLDCFLNRELADTWPDAGVAFVIWLVEIDRGCTQKLELGVGSFVLSHNNAKLRGR